MIELLNYIQKLQPSSLVWLNKRIMKCLFKEVYATKLHFL